MPEGVGFIIKSSTPERNYTEATTNLYSPRSALLEIPHLYHLSNAKQIFLGHWDRRWRGVLRICCGDWLPVKGSAH